MLSTIQLILQHNCHIGINKPVVIGVSGGADSLCLLDLLVRLGYPLIVAHLNHELRESADEDEWLVEKEARSRSLPFVTQKTNIRELAEENKVSIEEAARAARYDFLFKQARQHAAQAVAVAHTADDQVETVLMHLLRGSGLSGLSGLEYSTVIAEFDENIPLIRPLLGIWREEISAYLEEHGLAPAIDESNWDLRYHRNRLRHELLPVLESYNPQIRRAIHRMAGILRGEQEVIESVIDSAYNVCILAQGNGYVVFSAGKLLSHKVGIQRHLLRRGIDILRPGMRDIDFGAIERGLSALQAQGAREVELLQGLTAFREADRFILTSHKALLPFDNYPQVQPGVEYRLDIPGECNFPDGWQLSLEVVGSGSRVWQAASRNTDPFQAWMNLNMISAPVVVRSRRPGDRFCPLGMSGHTVKLSDFMINNKIPYRARAGWPLLECEGRIIWVPGFRQGHHTRLQSGDQRAVHIKLYRV